MKNVLIIASLYGSKRVISLARHLPELGWMPTVITPPTGWQPTIISSGYGGQDFPFRVIETGYTDRCRRVNTIEDARGRLKRNLRGFPVDRLFNLGGLFLNYPDAYAGWRRHALKASREWMMHCKLTEFPSAIISVCPVTAHVVAAQLKKESGLPWIADLPDLWSANHNYAYGRLRKRLDKRLERKTMAAVDAMTTSSGPRAGQLRRIHPFKDIRSIVLGFDHRKYDVGNVDLTKKFTITYTGVVYSKQDIHRPLAAVANVLSNGHANRSDWEVRFYGSPVPHLDEIAEELGIQDVVKHYGFVSHSEAVKAQMESRLLLLLDWEDPKELGVYPGKIFEYLGARRPILATGGHHDGVVGHFIRGTGSGAHAVFIGEITKALEFYYGAYKAGLEYPLAVDPTAYREYTQLEMARKYAGLLEEVDS